jgi:hypothetical protein
VPIIDFVQEITSLEGEPLSSEEKQLLQEKLVPLVVGFK